eukprot:m.779103 g.779103  ORF g.779103 m.779103 type:complete len:309 (+) comp23277_c0_seq7:184-1110(+)
MGCGTSTAESAPPIAPPAPLSRDAVVPEWAYGKYSVEILDLGITAANATFSASGLQWNDAVPRLPVLESTTNTFVFAMEGCSFRVNFDPQNQHTIPALFQAAAGQPWSKAVVTRLPGECPRETVMPVVSTSTLQRYNQLQSEMDELASADVHAEDLEGKIAYLRAQQEEANKNIAKWKAELEQISAANPGFNGYEPSAVDPNSDAYQRFVKATDGLQFAHAETTATASEIADMEAASLFAGACTFNGFRGTAQCKPTKPKAHGQCRGKYGVSCLSPCIFYTMWNVHPTGEFQVQGAGRDTGKSSARRK